MLLPLLTAVVWTGSSWFSARGARHLGGISANLIRVGLALPLIVIAGWCVGLGQFATWWGPGSGWFWLSGIIGMGLCDIAMLFSFSRLQARTPSLLVNGVGAPVAVIGGAMVLGELLSMWESLLIALVVASLVIALWPGKTETDPQRPRFDHAGTWAGVIAGVLFALSTLCSRQGYLVATAAGTPLHWLDATAIRLAGGTGITALIFLVCSLWGWRTLRDGPGRWAAAWPWLALNALVGPGLGLCLFQWSLSEHPAGLVQAIVAVIPALVMALAWCTGEERPSPRAIWATIAAVTCVATLMWVHAG